MFKRPGKHIKQNARILTIAFIVLWAIVGITMFVVSVARGVQTDAPVLGVLAGIAIGGGLAALGIWGTWAAGLLVYGYGVLVEKAEQPENRILAERRRNENYLLD